MQAIILTALVAVPLVLGIGHMIISKCRKIREGCQAANWPNTIGCVLESQMKQKTDLRRQEIIRDFTVRYSYVVNGQSYIGTTVHPTYGPSSDQDAHWRLQCMLQPGRKVRVYYRSDAPERSTLSVGFFSLSLAEPVDGLALLIMAVAVTVCLYFLWSGNCDFASGITVIE